MSLVHVEDRGLESERGEGAHAADSQEQLLANPVLAVAGVQRVGDEVDVEQVERHGGRRPRPDVVTPHVRGHRLAREVDLDGHRLALQAECLRVDRRVGLGLTTRLAQPLREIPTAIEQSDPDQGQPELGRRLQVVSREDAEATRVDRQAHVDAELHAEVGDEHVVVLVGLRPPRLRGARRLFDRVQDRDEASETRLTRSPRTSRRSTRTRSRRARAPRPRRRAARASGSEPGRRTRDMEPNRRSPGAASCRPCGGARR